MNDFYKQPIFLQWFEAILLLIIGFYPALLIFELISSNPLFYFLFLFYVPLGQFSFTPLFKLTGVYRYYSPMLIGYMANNVKIDLHNGSSFDYLFVMRKQKPGIKFRNRILIYHLEGLLNIIAQIENNIIPVTVNITGTSYFFNERTLNKLGFELKMTSLFYRINLFANCIDLIWMYSVAKGQISIPKIWEAKMASTTGSALIEHKDLIKALHKNLTLAITPK